jgi:putative copper resistance protein D
MEQAVHGSLSDFSRVGSAAVAILVASGLVNSWFLVGLNHAGKILTTSYGLVLFAKLLAFGGMLSLAISNRYFLTPRLGKALAGRLPVSEPIVSLSRSLLLESAMAAFVLGLVAWLGTLAPTNSP